MEKLKNVFTKENFKSENLFLYTLAIGISSMLLFLAISLFDMATGIYFVAVLNVLLAFGLIFGIIIPVGIKFVNSMKEFFQSIYETSKSASAMIQRLMKVNQ